MFELTEQTRIDVVAVMREKLPVEGMTDEELNQVLNEVVDVVKRQFGL